MAAECKSVAREYDSDKRVEELVKFYDGILENRKNRDKVVSTKPSSP